MAPLIDQRPVMICPFLPGISDHLKQLASSFGFKTWFTYPGKLPDLFTVYRGRGHPSKSMGSVYCCACTCGLEYIGESERNLKVRLSEHLHATSNSAISHHLRANKENREELHLLETKDTVVLATEKNLYKRRIIESFCIQNKRARKCNTGLSTDILPIWDCCAGKMAAQLPHAD